MKPAGPVRAEASRITKLDERFLTPVRSFAGNETKIEAFVSQGRAGGSLFTFLSACAATAQWLRMAGNLASSNGSILLICCHQIGQIEKRSLDASCPRLDTGPIGTVLDCTFPTATAYPILPGVGS
jgi:hypothetical protein